MRPAPLLALVSGAFALGCGQYPTAATPATRAAFAVSVKLIAGEVGPGAGVSWPIQVSVAVQETNGVGGYVEAVTATIRDTNGMNLTFIRSEPAVRVEPRGQAQLRESLTPGDASAGAPGGFVSVTVRLRDDRGNISEVTRAATL